MKRFTISVFNIILKDQLNPLGSAPSRKLRKLRVHDIYFGHLTRSKMIPKSFFFKSNMNTSDWTLVSCFFGNQKSEKTKQLGICPNVCGNMPEAQILKNTF